VGVIGAPSGIHESSTVCVWKICNAYKHAEKLSTSDEVFLNSNLLGVGDDLEEEEIYDKNSMHETFKKERGKIQRIRRYFKSRHNINIHAVGFAGMTNQNEYIKGYESAEYALQMMWIDMYYRKTIPPEIYEWDSDNIEEVIQEALSSAY
jgi:hypothetical protein